MSNIEFVVDTDNLQVRTSCILDAPRDKVWDIYTNPIHIPSWWGPRTLLTTVEIMEFRVGGTWRITQEDGNGFIHAFSGVYKEISPPEIYVATFEYAGTPGRILVSTVTFDEDKGRTHLTDTAQYATKEDLDMMVASGMEFGARESMERMGELVDALTSARP